MRLSVWYSNNFFIASQVIQGKVSASNELTEPIISPNGGNIRVNNNLKIHRTMRIFRKQNSLKDYRPDLNTKNWKGLGETDALNGPGSLIRAAALKKSGLASSDFFFGPEDLELSFRLKKFGKIGVLLDSEIYHEVAQSAKKESNIYKVDNSLREELIIRSRKYKELKSYLILIKKIGSFWDKVFGYGYFLLKLIIFL